MVERVRELQRMGGGQAGEPRFKLGSPLQFCYIVQNGGSQLRASVYPQQAIRAHEHCLPVGDLQVSWSWPVSFRGWEVRPEHPGLN